MSEFGFPRLLQSCLAGEAGATDELVATYRSAVFDLALSILEDPAEADEATQDVFVAALRSLHRYRGEAAFTTWLYAIALNVCRTRLGRRQIRVRLVAALQALHLVQPAEPDEPEALALQRESQRAVWRTVQALPEPQRLVVLLRYYHDLRLHEIAQALGVSERTVHNRLHAAHQRLKSRLNGRTEGLLRWMP